jgi:hypothetical protein
MGFSTLIDLLGSTIVGGLLFIILLRLNEVSTQNTFTYNGELQVQQNLVSVVQTIEYDFRKIGYCNDYTKINPIDAIISADSSSITFRTDLPSGSSMVGDGNVDIIQYYLGPTSELSGTPNPYDRKLYRVENGGTPKSANLGITEFRIIYFNAVGDTIPCPVATPGEIQTMQINVKVENTAAYTNIYTDTSHQSQYTSAFWRQIRLAARNLKNR